MSYFLYCGSPISPAIARFLLARLRSPKPTAAGSTESPLSRRETDVLKLVAKGMGFEEVANLLDISRSTVETHVKHIYRKLAVHSRGEAVFEATQQGLL